MTWKKYFRVENNKTVQPFQAQNNEWVGNDGSSSKFNSFLPEVYAGHPNRVQRYYQYDDMDKDSDINAALDTIADFCTQSEEQAETPFRLNFTSDVNETEIKILKERLTDWVRLNDFTSRLWYIFRNAIKNGDCFFLRDPETGVWLWIDHYAVEMVKVDESGGKIPDEYIIRGLDFNQKAKFATKTADPNEYRTPLGTSTSFSSRPMPTSQAGLFQLAGQNRELRGHHIGAGVSDLDVVDAKHIVHLSLSVGMDVNWPFGQSVLEPIFKTYKQKELLEDAVIIYRVQRAPERRVFYIDVGSMPPPKAKMHIEAIKNEIHQRRIPNKSGGGTSMLDAGYNPLSMMEDYFFAQTAEGRGSKVETLPGGDNLGEIGDLSFFTKKLARGLRVPTSYLSIGAEDIGATYSDGRVGTAMIQEYRFNKYCIRLQSLLSPIFDEEFKRFLRDTGITIDESLYDLMFLPPQNFSKYRQIELDLQQVSVYQQVADNKRLSERFKLKRFLNLTDEELIENEHMWSEENAERLKKHIGSTPAETNPEGDLSSVGIRPEPSSPFGGNDFDNFEEPSDEGPGNEAGDENIDFGFNDQAQPEPPPSGEEPQQ